MKFILFIPLLSITFLHAQDIPKKANTIIVKGVTFDEAAIKLLDMDFIIQSKDTSLQTITTELKGINKLSTDYLRIVIRIKEGNAIIYGNTQLETGITDDALMNTGRTYYGGAKGSPLRKCWDMLNAFALSFNKPVEYRSE